MNLEEFLKMIMGLTDEQKQQVKTALIGATDDPKEEGTPDTLKANEIISELPVEAEQSKDEPVEEEKVAESNDAAIDEAKAEEVIAETTESNEPPVTDDEATKTAEPQQATAIPNAETTKRAEAQEATAIPDAETNKMPADFEQIIEGLNAKILALQAENKKLKAKTEGAFGLTSKPGEYTKVNPLYGDDSSDIPRMRK
jgi:hypothetical protein